ncbi:unnamed protein product [Closterium sp. NIES-64]|nr:unnamed protein product [Closterium sp. NIES-64]
MSEAKRVRLGFVGAGQMAEALARGMSAAGVVAASDMSAMDLSQERLAVFAEMGVAAKTTCKELAAASDVIFIAVKPHTVKAVLSELRDSAAITSTHLVVSIAAGVTIANLQQWAGDEAKIVRVMPNTPCLVGQTAAAMSLGGKATAEDAALVRRMFEAVGKIQQVEEKLLDAVTGLSGSGPAYVFMAIEALADGGVAAGLPRDVALSLAAQTVYGSAKMVLETGKHPGQLKDSVASPGGTTIAGIYALEKGGFRATLMNAVVAATERSKELSKKLDDYARSFAPIVWEPKITLPSTSSSTFSSSSSSSSSPFSLSSLSSSLFSPSLFSHSRHKNKPAKAKPPPQKPGAGADVARGKTDVARGKSTGIRGVTVATTGSARIVLREASELGGIRSTTGIRLSVIKQKEKEGGEGKGGKGGEGGEGKGSVGGGGGGGGRGGGEGEGGGKGREKWVEGQLQVPPKDPHKLAQIARKNKPNTAGPKWYDLPAPDITPEIKTELQLLRMRNVLDPKRHYRSADSKKLPTHFQIGTVVEGAADFYSSRLTRRERKQSFAAELLHDEDLKKYRKRKFLEIAEENQRKGRRHLVKKQDRKNPTWARAAPNDDEVEEWRAGDSDNDGGENAHGDNAEAAADAQEAAVDANEEGDDEGGAELETVAPADAAAIADAVAESDKVATDAVLFDEEGGDDDPWSLGTDDDLPLLKRRLRHRLRSKSKRARVVLSDDDGPGEERRPILTAVEKGKAKVAEAPAKAPA